MFETIDHIGIAVQDIDRALAMYHERLQLPIRHREIVEEFGVEIVLLELGDQAVELLMPFRPDVPIGRFIDRHGAGMHHVAYRTSDIDRTLQTLSARGVQRIDEHPRTGLMGARVAYLHPRSTGGVLTELVEPAPTS